MTEPVALPRAAQPTQPVQADAEAERSKVRKRVPLLTRIFVFRAPLSPRAEIATGVSCSALVLALWELAVRAGWISGLFFPPPSVIAGAMWTMARDQDLLYHIGISVMRVWVAFLLSVVMAIPLGILMGCYRAIGAALEPLVDFIRYLPVPALVPLSIIWLGVGEETKIFLLWLGTFFQLILMVEDDMHRVPQDYVEIARTVGARPFQVLTDVAFRAMLPNLWDNMRICLGWCWTYLIIAEIVAADSGLGFVIWTARRYMKTPVVMAGVVAIGLIGLLSDQILRWMHRRMFRYL